MPIKKEPIQSIYNESDSESEPENEIVEEKKDVVAVAPKLNKNGKPKKVCTPEHLERLRLARIKAREVIAANTSIVKTRKAMQKEKLLLKKLQLEKEVQEHNNLKKQLMVDSGLAPETADTKKSKEKKLRKPHSSRHIEEENEDNIKLKELELELAALKSKSKKFVAKVEENTDSDSESEDSSEPEPVVVKKNRDSAKKPKEVKEPKKQVGVPIPVYKNGTDGVREPQDEEIKRQIRLLFPDF